MALYDKEEIKKTAIEAIKKHNLFFISDIVAYVPCSTSTFYLYFPEGSEESEMFKELLGQNRVKTKSAIRAKLFQSNKAGELLALYRLVCTPDERRVLNQQYIEMNAKDDSITINFVNRSNRKDKKDKEEKNEENSEENNKIDE